MGKVLSHMTMSLDGFIAGPNDEVDHIFDWYNAGEVSMASANPTVSFKLDAASAGMMKGLIGDAGVMVAGRRLFDITKGWSDNHPIGTPVVVVTHEPPADAKQKWPRTSFVDGVAPAIAKAREIAGDKNVILSSADIIQQALDLKLVDEVWVSLAPVLLGKGIPYFGALKDGPVMLDDPEVITGKRVTHLRYRVQRNR
jgi:dihydrofolate reductase